MSVVRESTVERTLIRACERRGWWALKLSCPGVRGVPDRMILMPGGQIRFVEVKRPGERPRADQRVVFARFDRYGHPVTVWDGAGSVDTFLDSLAGPVG